MPPVEFTASTPRPRAVLFDLDGTLVDPAGGITRGIAHGLRSNGLPVPDAATLDSLVGPPLALGLTETVGVPAHLLDDVVRDYRSWYAAEGMSLSRVYPGMRELLDRLAEASVPVAVATSKPQPIAEALLDRHGLRSAFASVVGTSADESEAPAAGGSKEHLVRAAAAALGEEPSDVAMVGDREYDMLAAVATGALPVGVAWGFAAPGELEAAGAVTVVDTADGILALLTPEVAA